MGKTLYVVYNWIERSTHNDKCGCFYPGTYQILTVFVILPFFIKIILPIHVFAFVPDP